MKKLLLSFFVLLLLISCLSKSNEKEEMKIVEIIWSNYGGGMGVNEMYIINKDSIFYSISYASLNNKTEISSVKIEKKDWNDLIKLLSIDNFSKIKDGKSNQPVDGTDTKISIVTNSAKFSVINGYDDELNYRKILPFIDKLEMVKTKITP